MLLYASDHGESLGEQGIYLHGMPYGFAPRVQKEVPMLFWASHGYQERTGLSMACMRSHAHDAVSHDNVYHTVLGAMAVHDAVYDPRMDLFAGCRAATPGHESPPPCKIRLLLSPISVLSSRHVLDRP